MVYKKYSYVLITLFFTMMQITVNANDDVILSNDLEMPDPLLQTTDPEKKATSYGEEDIVISGDGEKNNDIIKPDPILSTVEDKKKSTAKDIKLKSVIVTEQDQAIEHDDQLLKNTKANQQDDLEVPDPLLDNMN
ncbi:hypothetical protein MNBD_GAMMA22-982 [hydrothermal vent metagenome]|uniref:Uncharacterized protein n=1 Tax=hydrothermal vent metagenome TaxID=652676 RepID=A0A3B1A5D6_9ZZZZ